MRSRVDGHLLGIIFPRETKVMLMEVRSDPTANHIIRQAAVDAAEIIRHTFKRPMSNEMILAYACEKYAEEYARTALHGKERTVALGAFGLAVMGLATVPYTVLICHRIVDVTVQGFTELSVHSQQISASRIEEAKVIIQNLADRLFAQAVGSVSNDQRTIH